MFRNCVRRVTCCVRRRYSRFSAARHPSHALLLLLVTACSRDDRTPLVVYSPHGRDLLTLFEHRFEALHPDIDVRWLDMGSQDVYDRVRSERANPQADVWFGGPSLILAQAARDSLLDCRRAVWADAIAPRGRGTGDCYVAAYETPAPFLYAEKVVKPEDAPQDWDDLLDPKWKGKIIIRDPLASGTMRAVFGVIIVRGLKQTGDTAAGFAWLRRLDGQTKVYEQNPALVSEKIARQEGLVTIWDLPDVLISRRRGMPIGYVFPKSGTVAIEDGIAVVRCPTGCGTCVAAWLWPTSIGIYWPTTARSGCAGGTSTCAAPEEAIDRFPP